MTVHMKAIAPDPGLSLVAISGILGNHPDIADEAREQALQRVRELDYQPNSMARSLLTGLRCHIGLVVPDLRGRLTRCEAGGTDTRFSWTRNPEDDPE